MACQNDKLAKMISERHRRLWILGLTGGGREDETAQTVQDNTDYFLAGV